MGRDPFSPSIRRRLWRRLALRLALTAGGGLFFCTLLPRLLSLVLPFLPALLLAGLLDPVLTRLERRTGLPRRRLLPLVLPLAGLLAVGGAGGLLWCLFSELESLLQNWQGVWQELAAGWEILDRALLGLFARFPAVEWEGLLSSLLEPLGTGIPRLLTHVISRAGSYAMAVPSFLAGVGAFLLGTWFFCGEYPALRRRLEKGLSSSGAGRFGRLGRQVLGALAGYLRSELLLSGGVLAILLPGLLLLRQPYALLLALLLALLDLIPVVGAGTVLIPWAVLDLLLGRWGHGVALMVLWGAAALFRQCAQPRIVGEQTGLPPLLSLVSVYVGLRLGGAAGMVLGPVVCLVAVSLVRWGVLEGTRRDLALALRLLAEDLQQGES